MIPFERQEKLLQILKEKKSASIKVLSQLLYISEASVRRDVELLEQRGYVKRVYGGVMLACYQNTVVPLELRDNDHSVVKEELARRAAQLIHDGDTILLDGSSTVRRIVKYIGGKRNLKIITNNLRIFTECNSSEVQLYCTGGTFLSQNHIFIGPSTIDYLQGISANLLFFSSQGIDNEGVISDISEEETAIRRAMLSRAERKYFLCDASKIGIRKTFTLCRSEELNGVICDAHLPWE